MGGVQGGGPGGGSRGGVQGGGSRGGVQGGGSSRVEQIFSKKISFRKKNRRKGSRGLGAHFPPPYPGVTPPRIRRTGPPSSDFFGKNFSKKKFNLAKKMTKKIFFQNRFPYCILIVWDLH